MFQPKSAFSGFSVDDLDKAEEFYHQVLGLTVEKQGVGAQLKLPGGTGVFMYPKGKGHTPATYTILNFEVADIDEAVDELSSRGVHFEQYPDAHTDEKGIARGLDHDMGPNIAWFKDPAGNTLAVLQSEKL